MFKKILVPLDGSVMGEAVLRYARDLAKIGDSEIVLFNVSEEVPFVSFPSDPGLIYEVTRSAQAEARNYINREAELLMEAGVHAHAVTVDGGIAADQILDYAHTHDVDLIAMSTHGRSGISRVILGSVADKVVHGAKVPVLLIHPDLSQA